jgi:hypothetical protein
VDGGRAAPAASTNTFRKAVGDVKGAAVIKQRRIAASFHVLSPSLSVCVCGLKNYKLARFDGRDVCSFFFLFLQTSFVDFRRRGCATGGFRHATGAGFRDEGRKVNRMNKKEIEVIHGTKEVNCCVILLLSFFIMSETFFIHFILNPPYLCRGNFRCKESEKCAGGQIKSVDFFIITYYFVVGSMEEVVFATKLFKKDRVGWNL